jgi:hypothetical protein
LERPFFQKIGAEAVNGSDVGFFELGEAFVEPVSYFTLSVEPRFFELGSEAELELARRLLRERDGNEVGELATSASDHFDDASYQGGGFTGPRSRFHDECFVESGMDSFPRLVIIQVNSHQSETHLNANKRRPKKKRQAANTRK